MKDRRSAMLGTLLFFVIAPGIFAAWIPYMLSGWQMQPPLFGLGGGRVAGGVLLVTGTAILLECYARFALKGYGTPAPIAPPERLVVSGLYRHVRNPIYVGLMAILSGQALLFGNFAVLVYAGVVWLVTHVWVVLYEEPTLRRKFGSSYTTYLSNVRRWWPRIKPWHDSSDQ